MNLIVNKQVEIIHNMAQIKNEIESHLKKYDVIVTDDSVLPTKNLMATINKEKKEFTGLCKSYLDEIEAPIKAFKSDKKDIESLYDDAREKLSSQVDKFESGKLEKIRDILITHKVELCEKSGVPIERISVEDLIKLTAVTATYKPTKAVTDAIQTKISLLEAEIIKQQQAEKERDLEIEKARFEAQQEERLRQERLSIEKEQIIKDEALIQARKEFDTRQVLNSRIHVVKAVEPVVVNDKKEFIVTVQFKVITPNKENITQDKVNDVVNKKLLGLCLENFKVV